MTKTAIIGVHGVGEQVPGKNAAAIVTLLQRHGEGGYSAFIASPYSIPVDATGLQLNPVPKNNQGVSGLHSVFYKYNPNTNRTSAPSIDLDFTASLLERGDSYSDIYTSTAWRGTEIEGKRVDVYEMFWSDLSHGGGTFAVLTQLLQLLVHLASLGRTTAAAEQKLNKRGGWTIYYYLNAVAYWLLSMPIVLGNMAMVLVGSVVLTFAVPSSWVVPVGTVLCGLAMAWIVTSVFIGSGKAFPFSALLATLCGVAAGVLWWWGLQASGPVPLAGLVAVLGYFIGSLMVQNYQIMRPGAMWLWRAICVLILLIMGLVTYYFHTQLIGQPTLKLMTLTLLCYTAQGLFIALAAVWLALLIVALVQALFSFKVSRTGKKDAVFTCLAATLLPSPLLLGFIISFWAATGAIFNPIFKKLFPHKDVMEWKWNLISGTVADKTGTVNDITAQLTKMIDQSGGPFFVFSIAAVIVAMVMVLIGLLPSIVAEVSAPKIPNNAASKALGNWLNAGFVSICLAAVLAGLGFFAVLPLCSEFVLGEPNWLHSIIQRISILQPISEVSYVQTVGFAVGSAAVSFLAATKLLQQTVGNALGSARVAIDTLQDVDNWLRERPEEQTMRLQVFCRFYALFNYLREQGYDEVLIVAHSQGTVITADFLRYLDWKKINPLCDKPLTLFTVGSPLRQLYAWRFPALYSWAQGTGPDPAKCGLYQWVNAYGSGDYVGRALMTNQPGFIPEALPIVCFKAPGLTEFCIGAYAHTHYFDPDNAAVGRTIVRLA